MPGFFDPLPRENNRGWSPDQLRLWLNSQTIALEKIRTVTIDTPADNEVLAFDSASGDWINQTLAESGHDTHDHTTALGTANVADLADVDAWANWTPTLTNLTLGNGTRVARYAKIGTLIVVQFTFIFGTTSSISGDVSLTVPVTGSTTYTDLENYVGGVNLRDANGSRYQGRVSLTSTAGSFLVRVANASGTYLTDTALSSTVPFTWTTSDSLAFTAVYEAA